MKLTYELYENDFLQHQLFLATKSDRIRKRRIQTWLIVSGTMFLLGFLFYQSNNSFLFYYFIGAGVLSLIFYPLYQRNHYKKHYKNFVADTYRKRFGQTATIQFGEHTVETNDSSGEFKINLSELENVTETGEYFYPSLKTLGHFIIPKSRGADVNEVRKELKSLCEKLHIPFIEELNWKWK